MTKFILFLFFGLMCNVSIASQEIDTTLSLTKNVLSLKKRSTEKLKQIEIGEKLIIKTAAQRFDGTLQSVDEFSLTILPFHKNATVVKILFTEVKTIIHHKGLYLRIPGSIIQAGSIFSIALGLAFIDTGYAEFAIIFPAAGIGGMFLASYLKGKKYKMKSWDIIPK